MQGHMSLEEQFVDARQLNPHRSGLTGYRR